MRRLRLEIPGLPRMANASGRRSHWYVLKKEKDYWHSAVLAAVREQGFFGPPMAKAKLALTRHSSMEPDWDGLVTGFKRVIDGLKHARVIVDDKMSVIGQPSYAWEKAPPKKGRVTIQIEEVRA